MQRQRAPLYCLLNRLHLSLHLSLRQTLFFSSETLLPHLGDVDDPLYADVPTPRRDKSERKPYPTPMKILIQRAKQERVARKAQPCRMLEHPPDNGLLVPELIPLAHRVYRARESLLSSLAKLVQDIPVHRCRFCCEVHIGRVGHEIRTCTGPGSGFRSASHVWRKGRASDVVFFPKCFHLYDRVGKPRVGHNERHIVPRIPAIVELCVQAGVDLEMYPAKRRTKPVYSIEGRIVDYEEIVENDEMLRNKIDPSLDSDFGAKLDEAMGGWEAERSVSSSDDSRDEVTGLRKLGLRKLSIVTMDSWLEMISGTKKLMDTYCVLTCGYCPEVQVGPKGHKVRMCKATKHQTRDGQHAWQDATIDDLVGPNYVWHVRDLEGPPLDNNSKRYYGKAPAAVELCVQAGATVPDQYRSMMRLDVVPPGRDEYDLVA